MIWNRQSRFTNTVTTIYGAALILLLVSVCPSFFLAVAGDRRSVQERKDAAVNFALGGEIKETPFPCSWVVKRPDGSIWWVDMISGEGGLKTNTRLLWPAANNERIDKR